MSVITTSVILNDDSIKSTIVSVTNLIEIPLMEGSSQICEIILPERNDIIPKSTIDDAMMNKRRIAIRPARLQMLLDMEAKLHQVAEKRKQSLESLHAKEKENCEAVKERVKRYVDTHRDEINARRREKRKLAAVEAKQKSSIIIIKRVLPPKCDEKMV